MRTFSFILLIVCVLVLSAHAQRSVEKQLIRVDRTFASDTQYVAVIHGWTPDETDGKRKDYIFVITCERKFSDCGALAAGASYWLNEMAVDDPGAYPEGSPIRSTSGRHGVVLGNMRLTGRDVSVVYYIASMVVKDKNGKLLDSLQVHSASNVSGGRATEQ